MKLMLCLRMHAGMVNWRMVNVSCAGAFCLMLCELVNGCDETQLGRRLDVGEGGHKTASDLSRDMNLWDRYTGWG